jgi:hypothetical protein
MRARRDETGATLLLALGFMVVLGLIAVGMLSNIESGLHSRIAFDSGRNREYLADSAIQNAITQVRMIQSSSDLGPGLRTSCGPYAYPSSSNDQIDVYCSNMFQFSRSGFQQRNVVFYACLHGADCTSTPAMATRNSIIRAQVNFQVVGTGTGTQLNVTRTWTQSWSVNA